MSDPSMQWAVMLSMLGFTVPSIRRNGDVPFSDGHVRFVLMSEPDDPCYVHIVLPNVWNGENRSAFECDRASEICHSTNADAKVAKLIQSNSGSVFVSVEALFSDYPGAMKVLPRLIDFAKVAAHRFDLALHGSAAGPLPRLELLS